MLAAVGAVAAVGADTGVHLAADMEVLEDTVALTAVEVPVVMVGHSAEAVGSEAEAAAVVEAAVVTEEFPVIVTPLVQVVGMATRAVSRLPKRRPRPASGATANLHNVSVRST